MFYNEDARDKFLEDNSVDLFIVNPPLFVDKIEDRYGGDQSKQIKETNTESYLKTIMGITKNLVDALKQTGSIILLMPNTELIFLYIERAIREFGLKLGITKIWDWEIGFDYVVHLHKGNPYINETYHSAPVIKGPAEYESDLAEFSDIGNVSGATWETLYEILVKKHSREGDLVADIFGGTGTIAAVAKKTNRRFIYNDASSVQLQIAKARYESTKVDTKMQNKRYYTRDAGEPFLAPESVDLFLIHPPYFNAYSEPHGKPEGQLNNASDRDYFVNKIIDTIKHMEMALKPTGTIVVGLPTDENLYRIIGKINSETSLKYGPMFFWDFTNSPRIEEVVGKESNIFLNLHKGDQQVNLEYDLKSYTMLDSWVIPEELEKLSHLGHSHNSAPGQVYERIIQRYSKPGDVVADIMAATGQVLAIAKRLGRQTVYNDISDSQLRLAKYLIDGEEDVPMKMIRKEVIDLMTKEIQDMNVKQMENFNIPLAQQEQYIKESANELNRVNGVLFDMLVKHGVIQ